MGIVPLTLSAGALREVALLRLIHGYSQILYWFYRFFTYQPIFASTPHCKLYQIVGKALWLGLIAQPPKMLCLPSLHKIH